MPVVSRAGSRAPDAWAAADRAAATRAALATSAVAVEKSQLSADALLRGVAPLGYSWAGPTRRQASQTWAPLRIFSDYRVAEKDLSTTPSRLQLLKRMVAAAIADAGQLLRVHPATGPLKLTPDCEFRWPECPSTECPHLKVQGKCKRHSEAKCGPTPIPQEHLGSVEACAECKPDGTCTCNSTSEGEGVHADFVLYVTVRDDVLQCSSEVENVVVTDAAAFAATCMRDQYDRPIAAFLNFCPRFLREVSDPQKCDGSALKAATLRQIFHALVFSMDNFARFRKGGGGEPRTQRDGSGNPIMKFSDDLDMELPGDAVVQKLEVAGQNTLSLITPNALATARKHFDCPTLTGIPLESKGQEMHLNRQAFRFDIMAGEPEAGAVVSTITLAVFQDSGW